MLNEICLQDFCRSTFTKSNEICLELLPLDFYKVEQDLPLSFLPPRLLQSRTRFVLRFLPLDFNKVEQDLSSSFLPLDFKAPAKRVQHFIKHHTTFVAHYCMLVNRVNRGVAKRMQHFVQRDTTFLQKYSK